MGFSSLKARFSFQAKVLVPVVTVMVLLMAGTMWLANRRISEQLYRGAEEHLDTAGNMFKAFEAARLENLASQYQNLVNEPRFKAVTGQADIATTTNLLHDIIPELINDYGASVATFTFVRGVAEGQPKFAQATRDPKLDVGEFESRSRAAIRQALKGQTTVDTIGLGGRIFYVVAVPVGTDDEVNGVVTFGGEIGADVAAKIKAATRSEILFVSDGRAVVSTLNNSDLQPKLLDWYQRLSAAQPAAPARNTEIPFNKRMYLGQTGHFSSLGGDSAPGYLLLSSYEQPFLRSTQKLLLAAGLFGILVSTLIVWFLVGKVTQPLRQLRDSAEAVGRGDFSKRVEVNSQDECGELAAVFNRMTENLETSRQELEKTVNTLKNTQNQLIQSEKLSGIGEFVAGVAHELNNPLTSVMGFAELLQQSDMPEQQRRYLDVIFKSAKRCQKIVSSLLSFARRHAPERKVVCINEIVESAVEILHYQMRTSNIEVTTELDPNLPATEVDSHQMQQVFLNIINNARQAMEGQQTKGRLRVKTETAEGRVRVSFQDNGPGIPADNLKKIFNPFFTTKEVGKGTGLGLSLCYGIVSEHGGTITPYSQDGEGATFVIELPVSRQAATEAEKKASVPLPAQTTREGVGKRVLVIDDEDSILQMIREVLMRNGYRVDIARDGEAGLQRLNQYHYDLALCDWKMPGLNGQQIFEKLHESNPDMSKRLIFITGDVVNEKTQEFLKARHKVCLSKPFTLVEFRSAINRVMAAAGEG